MILVTGATGNVGKEVVRALVEGKAQCRALAQSDEDAGQLADLAVLSSDFFTVPEEQIRSLESVLTGVGGRIVYAKDDYQKLAPPDLPISPSWSPVKTFGSYHNENSGATS